MGAGHDPIRLAGSDYAQALFVHVPKTAGKSFLQVLTEAKLGQRGWLPAAPKLFRVLGDAGRYPILHGHVPYPVGSVLGQPLFVMTFLRNPVDRVISYFEYIERRATASSPRAGKQYERWQRNGFESAVDLATRGGAMNGQISFLGADCDFRALLGAFEKGETDAVASYRAIQEARKRARGHEGLARAMERVAEMPFVGISERFDDSVRLFAHIAGLPSPAKRVRENFAPAAQRQAREAQYGEDAVRVITERNQLDLELYDFASELFDRRYRDAFGDVSSAAAAGPTVSG